MTIGNAFKEIKGIESIECSQCIREIVNFVRTLGNLDVFVER